jgi:DDE superfamily endonuclease
VVSVSSLFADEEVYYPLEVEPYTPSHHFRGGKNDPGFRTKLKIACRLVERAVGMGVPFRAVVADSFYGEDRGFKRSLEEVGVGYVLSLKKSHSWWHAPATIGALWEAALAAGWEGSGHPGGWEKVVRTYRDGHREGWWALEVEAGPYGTERAKRALVVSTDPATLPDLATWYLTTNLPAPESERAQQESDLAPASVAEVVRLYGSRMWVEQSYKQVKHALGWSGYQARSDHAIRRHWELWCAVRSRFAGGPSGACRLLRRRRQPSNQREIYAPNGQEKKRSRPRVSWPEALRAMRAWLEAWVRLWRYWRAFSDKPPPRELRVLLERLFSGEGLYLYVR